MTIKIDNVVRIVSFCTHSVSTWWYNTKLKLLTYLHQRLNYGFLLSDTSNNISIVANILF
jgi:hypothetical protein